MEKKLLFIKVFNTPRLAAGFSDSAQHGVHTPCEHSARRVLKALYYRAVCLSPANNRQDCLAEVTLGNEGHLARSSLFGRFCRAKFSGLIMFFAENPTRKRGDEGIPFRRRAGCKPRPTCDVFGKLVSQVIRLSRSLPEPFRALFACLIVLSQRPKGFPLGFANVHWTLFAFLTFLFFIIPFSVLASDPHLSQLENKSLSEFVPPPIQIHIFENGLKLYFLRNKELPIFEMEALIEMGSIDETDPLKGLASFMMSGLRTGGSKKFSGDEIDQKIEQVAARLSGGGGDEYSDFGVSCLTKDLDLSLEIYFDLIQYPRFEEPKLEIIRKAMLDNIRRRNEQSQSIAVREFKQQLYGADSIWARLSTEKTIQAITRDDLIEFHKKFISPDCIWLAVSGDLSLSELIKKLEPFVKNWPAHPVQRLASAPVVREWQPSLQLIHKEGNQSSIILGHFGDKRFNPDKYALILANYVLGGSTFGSRLGDHIRTALGLAYSIGSDFGLTTDYGVFRISSTTKSASTERLIVEVRQVLEDLMRQKQVTPEELSEAKKTLINTIIFQYADPFNIVKARVRYDYYGYPEDYLSIFQKEIEKVSLQQVNEVLNKYFYPDKLKILIVGDRKEVGDLKQLGKLEELPLDYD